MGIDLVLNPGQYAFGDAQGITADGVAKHGNLFMGIRQAAQGQGFHTLEKRRVVHRDERQVGLMGHEYHPCGIALGIIEFLGLHVTGIRHHVGIGENPVAVDQGA